MDLSFFLPEWDKVYFTAHLLIFLYVSLLVYEFGRLDLVPFGTDCDQIDQTSPFLISLVSVANSLKEHRVT
ncbi:MAG: hypothetical protein COA75_09390 [Cellvibrionales bacterium]|nr:MAG: hypothetical protein COA75_09390 [Cellvibrionales bacterium]